MRRKFLSGCDLKPQWTRTSLKRPRILNFSIFTKLVGAARKQITQFLCQHGKIFPRRSKLPVAPAGPAPGRQEKNRRM